MKVFTYSFNLMKFLFILFSVCLFQGTFFAQTQVEKIFYHVMNPATQKAPESKTIELAKLVLYFSDTFLISQLPEGIVGQSKGYKTVAFILPGVSAVSPELKKELNKYAALDERHFRIAIAPIQTPTQGLSIKISYEPEWISVAVHEFKTIGNQHGLVFTCYDKKCIESLKNAKQTVLQVASLERPTIVVDCGHGGHDTGACGFFNIKEKELVKKVGDRLAHELKKKGWNVVMTRHADEFVPLDARTFKINSTPAATVAVSLHANSGPSHQAQGIETFYYDPVLLTENVKNKRSDISFCMKLSDNTIELSKKLAHHLQSSLIASASTMNSGVIDRRSKPETAQVLMGSAIPTVLVEMGFLSNRQEARLLANRDYQSLIVAGLVTGLEKFVQSQKERA